MPGPLPLLFGWGAISSFVIALLPSIISRLFALVGLSIVSYFGFELALDEVKTAIFSNYNSLPTDALQLLDLAGGHAALSIMLTGMTTALGVGIFCAALNAGGRKKSIQLGC